MTAHSLESRRKPGTTREDFAKVAFTRTSEAIDGYQQLGDRWDTGRPSIVAVLDVTLDAVVALEAALKAIAASIGIAEGDSGLLPLFQVVVARPETPASLRAESATYRAVLDEARKARNAYVHGEVPEIDSSSLLGSVRGVIRLNLLLASGYEILGKHWRDLADTLWRFDGQPMHIARQVRAVYSGRRFAALPLRCFVSRFTGGSQFRLDGALRAYSDIAQPTWEWSGDVEGILPCAPATGAIVGMVGPPERGEARTAEGTSNMEGTLRLVARELDVMNLGDLSDRNPLATPIPLLPDEDCRAWMIGPGQLRLRHLDLRMPYRARVRWFLTPGDRQEVLSEFLDDYEAVGSVTGEMAFHYAGHRGLPAFRGVARLSGTTGPCQYGHQLAHWTHVRTEKEHDRLKGWMWGDVLRTRFSCRISLTVDFDDVEVFPVE